MIQIDENLWLRPEEVAAVRQCPRGFAQPEAVAAIHLRCGEMLTTAKPATEVMALLFPAPILPKNIGRGGIAPC